MPIFEDSYLLVDNLDSRRNKKKSSHSDLDEGFSQQYSNSNSANSSLTNQKEITNLDSDVFIEDRESIKENRFLIN